MRTEFPDPVPEPIRSFSPTLANDLLACSLRVGFARDPSFSGWKRPSTFSVLGDAAHAVAELVAKHRDWPAEPGALRSRLEEAWNGAVRSGAQKLAAAWAPAAPPAIEEWPTYQVTRARTLRRAERAIKARDLEVNGQPTKSGEAPHVVAGTEVKLVDAASGLEGRADRIDRIAGTYRVVDLKTGMYQGEPKEAQLRQLLLYAVLVHRATGEWPLDIAVEDASGERYVVPLEPSDAEAALEEVVAAVHSFNDLASTRAGGFEAKADADTCRWCAYRVCCDAYWRELSIEWGHNSVLGALVDAGADATGAHADVDVVAPADLGASRVHVFGLPEAPALGSKWLAMADLHPIRDPRTLRARWSSRIAAI